MPFFILQFMNMIGIVSKYKLFTCYSNLYKSFRPVT